MSFETKIKKYARLAIAAGVKIQPGQLLVITADVDCAWYVRILVEEAYRSGAGEVVVNWNDSQIDKLTYEYADDAILSAYPQWRVNQRKEWIDRHCAFLSIGSPNPALLQDVDSSRIQCRQKAASLAMKPFRYYTSASIGQWSCELLPNVTWAKMVFPELSDQEAYDALFEAIFKCCRIDDEHDPIEAWEKHTATIVSRGEKLNAYQFKKLCFKNQLGTDIEVELVRPHRWGGGLEVTPEGVAFVPNLPTEEIFCIPRKDGVNGTVYASRPLNIQGKLVKDFWFRFEEGKVVDYGASENLTSLKNLLEMDEGAMHLGAVAMISYDSPISQSNLIYYNGLIDENASCHMALGNCYPMNIPGGNQMSEKEMADRGANFSMIHCDFMFGTSDLSVIGVQEDDSEVVLFKDGNFVI